MSARNGNIYFLSDDERLAVLWAINLGLAYDDGFSQPRDANREILRSALARLDAPEESPADQPETET